MCKLRKEVVMRIASGLSMVALAVTLALGISTAARAEDAKPAATGTVSGKVVDADGKGVKGVQVMAVKPMERGGGGNAAGGGGGNRQNRQRPEPLAKGETGDDGTYKLENVPAGKVMVVARLEDQGGRSQNPVDVTAGQDTKVGDITLAKRPQGGGRGGRQGGEAKKNAQ
jgi:hypothetical protein